MKRSLPFVVVATLAIVAAWFTHRSVHSRGDIAEMQRLRAHGAQVDAVPAAENGAVMDTPALQVTVEAGQAAAVKWLLDHGADPNRHVSDASPLAAAVHYAGPTSETANILRANGAK